MKLTLYDYENKPHFFDLLDKQITEILVAIYTGDEIATVFYEDGDLQRFDSGCGRMADYDDGAYILNGEEINGWMNFDVNLLDPEDKISYERQKLFGFIG